MAKWKKATAVDDRHVCLFGSATLIVEHRKGHPPDAWVAWSLPALIAEVRLDSRDLDAAKAEAVALFKRSVASIAKACEVTA